MLTRIEQLRLWTIGDKDDASRDELLNLLLQYAESRFRVIMNRVQAKYGLNASSVIPDEFNWILDEVAVKRFNRIGSEGFSTETVDGHSISFETDEFLAYEDIIDRHFKPDDKSAGGRVVVY